MGISTLALVYAAHVGTWSGAGRLVTMLRWSTDMINMERWHTDGKMNAITFGKGPQTEHDPYDRGGDAARRLTARASNENATRLLSWIDEVVIALLAIKFASLTRAELDWKETGKEQGPSVQELLYRLQRWNKGWEGQPGTWLREWTSFKQKEIARNGVSQGLVLCTCYKCQICQQLESVLTMSALAERRPLEDPEEGNAEVVT